jgi:hypothetical protein
VAVTPTAPAEAMVAPIQTTIGTVAVLLVVRRRRIAR